jgi:GTPase SAR1 family protein
MSSTPESKRSIFLAELSTVVGLTSKSAALKSCFINFFLEDKEHDPVEFALRNRYSANTINSNLRQIYKFFEKKEEFPFGCPGLGGKNKHKYIKLRVWINEQFFEWMGDCEAWRDKFKSRNTDQNINYLDLAKEYGLPSRTYDQLVGRELEIEKIFKGILKNGCSTFVVYGVGGAGKTSLITEVAYRYADISSKRIRGYNHFDKIIWTSAQTKSIIPGGKISKRNYTRLHDSLNSIIREIAKVCEDQRFIQFEDVDDSCIIEYAIDLLRDHKTLLVIDNFESIDLISQGEIASFIQQLPGTTKVIITTRNNPSFFLPSIPITSLPISAAEKLLFMQLEKHRKTISDEQKSDILKCTGGVPAAIIIAAGLLASNKSMGRVRKEFTSGEYARFYFEEAVRSLDEKSLRLLLGATFFRYPTTMESIAHVADVTNIDSIEDGIENLRKISFINEDGVGKYYIPNLIREYALSLFEMDFDSDFGITA